MSQENVEIVRAALEDLLSLDESTWEAWLARFAEGLDPAVEWDASEAPMPDIADVRHGREAVLNWWREWFSAWETLQFEYELVDAGDRVVLLLDQRMRGRSTGIEVPTGKYAHISTFKDGLLTHWKYHASQTEALEAVELSR